MASYNSVNLIGRLTHIPELRTTPNGRKVVEVGIAVNRKYKTQDGFIKEETTFVDIVVWERQAEIMAEHLQKGSRIFIAGYLQQDRWQDKDTGKARSKLKVNCRNFEFLDPKQQQQSYSSVVAETTEPSW
ncbi:single-stranded DNA-binding protein [Candidatus Uabimicrobium amorphum]|uniref:Single-stranded DNA-binding protein n=1 Tax=Uabimicrobium amorphum TaxID=2596890 RepID=A0A5S9IW80_UABAM|nr:single-stranded DNA-binding protein [Candidatus Uabimicrobium amorphum]BBM88220.1 single-stranded DNA-binding protein [Candidatus Uabimicrobium amorphum]